MPNRHSLVRFSTWTKRLAFFVPLLAAIALPTPSAAQIQELNTLKQNTDRWIELRTKHAEEAAKWKLDKSVLQGSLNTLNATATELEKDLEFYQSEQAGNLAELENKRTRLEKLEAIESDLRRLVFDYERRILGLVGSLPPPLKEKLDTLVGKIPASADSTDFSLTNRLQNIVATLSMIDEFNNALTHVKSIRQLADGKSIEVRILYFGLAAGFATDATGSKTWILKPNGNDWTWTAADQNAASIFALFQVYGKEIDPIVVEAPLPLPQN